MLNRLKWRFIRINMLLVGVAVAIMFGSVCMLTYRNGRSQVDRAMDNALRIEERPNGLNFGSVPQDPPAEIPQDEANGQAERPDVRLPSFGGKDNLSYIYTVTVVVLPDGSYQRADAFGADIDSEVLDLKVLLGVGPDDVIVFAVLGARLLGVNFAVLLIILCVDDLSAFWTDRSYSLGETFRILVFLGSSRHDYHSFCHSPVL